MSRELLTRPLARPADSELLRTIAQEMGYFLPPPANSFVYSLQAMQERADSERAAQVQVREQIETNRKTLTNERDRLAAYLNEVSYVSSVADVAAALSRRAAVEFLLERAPELPAASLTSAVDAKEEAALRLQAWHGRLVVERQRIESELLNDPNSRRLLLDLEAVKSAMLDASSNLREAANAGLIDRKFLV
ncbi:MAG TPA: hypothetical protein VIQ24_24340 [Pyrinomonadaceae bacterium]